MNHSVVIPIKRYAILLAALSTQALAAMNPAPGQVVANGTVPDEATRVAVLGKLKELYGAERVVDQISVGGVVSPPNWSQLVQKILTPTIKQINRGQVKIDGTSIGLQGEVANEAQRQQIVSEVATGLTSSYVVKSGLRVVASEQNLLDQALANRIIEFDTSSTNLTGGGRVILDEMSAAIKRLGGKKIDVIGHTDSSGTRAANLALSAARADAVKAYLVSKGVDAGLVTTQGAGPDRPVATNDLPEGRARNRRIEFRVGQ